MKITKYGIGMELDEVSGYNKNKKRRKARRRSLEGDKPRHNGSQK